MSQLESLRLPAIHARGGGHEGFSKLGGLPDVPADFVWPEWKGAPLAFLAQISLEEVASVFQSPLLPPSGFLYFFYNQEQSTWGFDPKDKGSWAVFYFDHPRNTFKPFSIPTGLNQECVWREKKLGFKLVQLLPDLSDHALEGIKFDDAQFDAFDDLRQSVYEKHPAHQLLGYPSPVQNPMELECQLVSNGLYCGDSSGYENARAAALKEGASEWRLLFQLDTDDDTGMMWGDAGMLYFWMKESDLLAKNFDGAWMILQCC